MMLLQKKNVELVNYVTSGRNPDSTSGIYLTYDKVAQWIFLARNSIEKK